tara:strand:+ start:178839 stop:182468 length:3630 start_codon:yes stop_codon:yes gene_type:complete
MAPNNDPQLEAIRDQNSREPIDAPFESPDLKHLSRSFAGLRLRFAFSLLVLFLVFLIDQLVSSNLLSHTENDAAIINTSGRQRLLIQSIATNAYRIDKAYSQRDWPQVEQAALRSIRMHHRLEEGYGIISSYMISGTMHNSLDDQFQKLLERISLKMESYIAASEQVYELAMHEPRGSIETKIALQKQIERLDESAGLYIADFDQCTAMIAQSSILDNHKSRNLGKINLTIIGLLILCTLLFVIEPGVRANLKVLKHSRAIADQAMKVKHELGVYHKAANQASMVLTTDPSGIIISVNDAFCTISGYSREELVGKNCRLLSSGYHPQLFFKDLFTTIGCGQLWNGEIRNRRKDGSLYWVDTTIVPLFDKQGEIEQYYSLRVDITRQKETELELQAILDALPSMIIYKDEKNNLLRVNASLAATFGLSPEEMAGQQSGAFFSGSKALANDETDLEILAKGVPVKGRIEPVTLPDGVQRTMRIDKIPLMGASGYFSRIVTLATDMTEIVEMEQRFALAIESAKAGIWDWDMEQGTLYTNEMYFKMLGIESIPCPFPVEHIVDRIHPEDQGRVEEFIGNCIEADKSIYTIEIRIMHQDGSYRWIQSTGKVINKDQDGAGKRMIGQHLDIDSSKRLDIAIRTALELKPENTQAQTLTKLCAALSETTQSTFAGIARLITKDGIPYARLVAGSNQGKAVEPFEYKLDGTPCGDATNQKFCIHTDCVAEAYPSDTLLTEMNAQGYAGLLIQNSMGEDLGIIMIIDTKPINSPVDPQTALKLFGARASVELEYSDTQTRLTEAADLAESLSQSKSNFLANMSHEIRTPMTAILGFAELLEESDTSEFSNERRSEAIKTIRSNGEHLLSIINDILDISKVEAGKMTIERMTVKPIEIIQQVVTLLSDRISRKGLDFHIQYATPIPETIQSDPTRFRQVLLNLLGNAIKFTEEGSIIVRCSLTELPNPQLQFEIIDTGIGMTDEHCERVFDAFSQADSSTTRRFGGTGLGLSISKSIVEILGGTISVKSAINRGTCFTITINPGDLKGVPLLDAPEQTKPKQDSNRTQEFTVSHTPDQLKGRRILLVEDGPDNQRLISYHFRRAGAEVDVANNGQLGIDALTKRGAPHYDLVLMDMQMPVLDGYAASSKLRELGFTLPIVALTAHAMSGDREKCLRAGCDAYQPKPINKLSLIGECAQLINSGHQWNGPESDSTPQAA